MSGFRIPEKARVQLIAEGKDPDELAHAEPEMIPGQLDLTGNEVAPPPAERLRDDEPVAAQHDDGMLAPVTFPFYGSMTVLEARDLLVQLATEGHRCPTCSQWAKVYKRALGAGTARALIALYREHGMDWGHMATLARTKLTDIAHRGGYLVLSAHWGLIEEESKLRPDGGRGGWWRVTDLGREFVLGQATVPKYAYVYDAHCLQLDGPLVSIAEALGTPFSYADEVRGSAT